MPADTRLARRFGAPVVLVTVTMFGLFLTSGCATKKTQYADYDDYDGAVSAREYGYVRPASDVWVLGEAGKSRRRGRTAAGGDLWDRVRTGMQLDLHASPRIDSKLNAFRRDPQYLARLSQRARPYLHVIVGEIERRGLPAELALLPHVESGYNPAATSPKAAAGMWQFIPSTGRIMGLRQDNWYDGRRDVLASTRAAMDYLEQLNRRLGGDWELAMAAYNCGPARVESAQAANRRRGKPTDFWSLDLPTETENYVPQILAAARLVSEPAKYGMRLPPVPNAPQLELVRTDRPVDLARVAQASGVGLTELKRLNPGLKRGQTAPGGPSNLLVPAGAGKQVSAKLASARVLPAAAQAGRLSAPALAATSARRSAAPARPAYGEGKVHAVKGGESLRSIASAQGMDPQDLADFNGMLVSEPLLPGQSLRLPGAAGGSLVTHRVRKGDSLAAIARRYGVTVRDIKRWNEIAANDLRAGSLIRIYRRSGETAS